MKKLLQILCLVTSFMLLSSLGFAQSNQWEKEFIQALQKGKALAKTKTPGLAYTAAESSILEKAVKQAMEAEAPPCEAMKIAVDLKYKPYDVITNIFGYGGELDLNQLCMCATETGINKQIVAKAANEAVNPIGQPVFQRDEIAQAQCLNIGLPYTSPLTAPPPIEPPKRRKPFSVAGP